MNLHDFYADSARGSRFGVSDQYHAGHPHRGLDFIHAAGTGIPSPASGTVVLIQYSTIIGWVTVLKMSNGHYLGFAHQRHSGQPQLGEHITKGARIGYVAGDSEQHGRAWFGPHLHITYGPDEQSIFIGTVWNPQALIHSALGSSLAGVGGVTPVKIPKDGNNMAPRVFNHKIKVSSTVKGKTVTKTVKEWVRFWETSVEKTQSGDHCNLWKSEAGQISATKNLTPGLFDYLTELVNKRRALNNLPPQS